MASSAIKNGTVQNKWNSENTYDPVTSSFSLTYNTRAAHIVSKPAYYTGVCLSTNTNILEEDFLSYAEYYSNGDVNIDNDILFLDKTVSANSEARKMCQNDSKPSETYDFLEDNATFTNFGTSVSLSQDSVSQVNGGTLSSSLLQVSPISFSGSPFLNSIDSNARVPLMDSIVEDARTSAIAQAPSLCTTFQGMAISALDMSTSACDVSQSLNDDNIGLYNSGSEEGGSRSYKFNFESQLKESLRAEVQEDSSIEIIDSPKQEMISTEQNGRPSNADVIEIVDSDEDASNASPCQNSLFCISRVTGSERIMPQLMPHGSDLDSQDENNDSRASSKSDSIEVIDVPSSPEMPKLIPFTSETEEVPKVKLEDAKLFSTLSNSFSSNLQPKVLLEKLPFESCSNKVIQLQKEPSGGYVHIIKPEEIAVPLKPDIDVIDGLNFYSFSSKTDMEKYWEKFSDTMPFQVACDDDDSSEDFLKDYGVIVPTKTNDITQIKGWRTKSFAPESRLATERKPLEDRDVKDENNGCAPLGMCNDLDNQMDDFQVPEIPVGVSESDNIKVGESLLDGSAAQEIEADEVKEGTVGCNELQSKVLDKHIDDTMMPENKHSDGALNECIEKTTTTKELKDIDSIPFNSLNKESKTNMPMGAFVSEALESYLKNESQLNVAILQQRNPNIMPIPKGSSILSIGNLRKQDRKDCRNLSPQFNTLPKIKKPNDVESKLVGRSELLPSSLLAGSTEGSTTGKVWQKSSGMLASAKVLKKSRCFKSRSNNPVSPRVVMRLKKEHSGTVGNYKVTEVSSEITTKPEVGSLKKKTKADPSLAKEPVLLKQTLFSEDNKELEINMLNNFLTNLNRLGTRNDLTMLVNSNQTYFTTPVITHKCASVAVSAVTSVENLIKRKKQAAKQSTKSGHSLALSSKRKSTLYSEKTKENSHSRQNSADFAAKSTQSVVAFEMRGKRSIRLPARFLDSAILAAGTEWVSPNVDVEVGKRTKKNNSLGKESKDIQVIVQSKESENCSSRADAIGSNSPMLEGPAYINIESQGHSNGTTAFIPKHTTTQCTCKNISRTLVHDSHKKQPKCQCNCVPAENDFSDSGQSKQKLLLSSVNLHDYAAVASTLPQIVSISGAESFKNKQAESSEQVASCQNPKEDNYATNDQKNSVPLTLANLKPGSITVPGKNKCVSLFVYQNSPVKVVSPPSTQNNSITVSPARMNLENANVSLLWNPPASSTSIPVKPMVCLPVAKSSVVVKNCSPNQAPVYPVISGVYCSPQDKNKNNKTNNVQPDNVKKHIVSKLVEPGVQGKESDSLHMFPLNSNPVVFTLSPDALIKTDSSHNNFKSFEVKQNHIYMKSNGKTDLLPTGVLKPCPSHEAQTPRLLCLSESSIVSSSVNGNSNFVEETVSPEHSKKPQSLAAVKCGKNYILCPMSGGKKVLPDDNTITLYPAADDLQACSSKSNGPIAFPLATRAPELHKALTSDTISSLPGSPAVSCETPAKSKALSAVCDTESKSAEVDSDFFIDVESLENSDMQDVEENSSSCFSLRVDGASPSSSTCISLNVSSEEEENNEALETRLKPRCNRKNLMERNRRLKVREGLNALRMTDPILHEKRSTVELIDATTEKVKLETKRNFMLGMQVKNLLTKREVLMKKYKTLAIEMPEHLRGAEVRDLLEKLRSAVKLDGSREFPSPPSPYLKVICQKISLHAHSTGRKISPEEVTEVLSTLHPLPCCKTEVGSNSTSPSLSPSVVSKMRMNLKLKMKLGRDSESPNEANCSDNLKWQQHLKCSEKMLLSGDELASESERIDVDDPPSVEDRLNGSTKDEVAEYFHALGVKPLPNSSPDKKPSLQEIIQEEELSNHSAISVSSTSSSPNSLHENDSLGLSAAAMKRKHTDADFELIKKKKLLRKRRKKMASLLGGVSNYNNSSTSDHSYTSVNKPNEDLNTSSELRCSKGSTLQICEQRQGSRPLPTDLNSDVLTPEKGSSSLGVSNHLYSTLKLNGQDVAASLEQSVLGSKSKLFPPKGGMHSDLKLSVPGCSEVVLSVSSLKKTLAESLNRGEKANESITKVLSSSEQVGPPSVLAGSNHNCLGKEPLDFIPLVIDESTCNLKENDPCAVSVGDIT